MTIQGIKITDFIANNKGYFIPFYQREYTWGKVQVKELLNDINDNMNESYYLGNIVVKRESDKTIIVDGQQRLSTIMLLIKVLSKRVTEPQSITNINYWLNTQFRSENLKDGLILKKILSDGMMNASDKESLYYKNYILIGKEMDNISADDFYIKLQRVMVASILADSSVDEHKLFAQINSTGKKLTSFDLVKNHLFSTLESGEIELFLEKIGYISDNLKDTQRLDMLRHFCAYENGILVKKDDVLIYEEIKKIKISKYDNDSALILDSIFEFGLYYNFLMSEEINDNYKDEIKILLNSFGTYAIILIDIFKTYSEKNDYEILINNEQMNEIKKALLVLEAYKVRREFVNLKEKELTRFIPLIPKKARAIENCQYDKKLIKILLIDANKEEKGYRMPSVDEFKSGFIKEDIYNIPKFVKQFLLRLENYEKNEKIDILEKDLNIEHIMPQEIELWKKEIHYDSEKHIETLHTIGNLTLLNFKDNSYASNKIFSDKKKIIREKSSLKLNQDICEYENWDYDIIHQRAINLFDKCQRIWNIDSRYDDFSEIEVNNEKEHEVKEKERLLDKESNYEVYLKNQSYFRKIKDFSYGDVESILYNLFVKGLGTKENEIEVFNVDVNGWISQAIYGALEINGPINKKSLSDEQFIERIKELNTDIILFVNYVNNN